MMEGIVTALAGAIGTVVILFVISAAIGLVRTYFQVKDQAEEEDTSS